MPWVSFTCNVNSSCQRLCLGGHAPAGKPVLLLSPPRCRHDATLRVPRPSTVERANEGANVLFGTADSGGTGNEEGKEHFAPPDAPAAVGSCAVGPSCNSTAARLIDRYGQREAAITNRQRSRFCTSCTSRGKASKMLERKRLGRVGPFSVMRRSRQAQPERPFLFFLRVKSSTLCVRLLLFVCY